MCSIHILYVSSFSKAHSTPYIYLQHLRHIHTLCVKSTFQMKTNQNGKHFLFVAVVTVWCSFFFSICSVCCYVRSKCYSNKMSRNKNQNGYEQIVLKMYSFSFGPLDSIPNAATIDAFAAAVVVFLFTIYHTIFA